MGGIISLITKKAVFDEDLEPRITSLEVHENTSKSRIESQESWIQMHDEKIKKVSDKAEKDHEDIGMLKKKLVSFEGMPKHDKDKAMIEKKCKQCKETYSRNFDQEKQKKNFKNAPHGTRRGYWSLI